MTYNPEKYHRCSIRLQNFDYSLPGAYFITIRTQNHICQFGEIIDGKMKLNHAGCMVSDEWMKTGKIRDKIKLDEFVIMPNHFHGIVVITGRGTARRAPTVERFGKPVPGSIPTIVRAFKSAVTKRFNQIHKTPGTKLWQRNYWEHVIRDEIEFKRIRQYIQNNPKNWDNDKLNGGIGNRITENYVIYGEKTWMV